MLPLPGTLWKPIGQDRPVKWRLPAKKCPAAAVTTLLFLSILVVAALLSSSWITTSTFPVTFPEEVQKMIEIPLICSTGNRTQTCPGNYPRSAESEKNPSLNSTCPEYFRWIHEDLRPFRPTGITREMVERGRRTAHFRLVVVQGKVYIEKYKSIQTRDVFTLWGILQLLRRYPGRLPDLELMFDCDDKPVVRSRDHRGPNSTAPPTLFRYCSDRWSLDVVFPDWSFWGWAAINIKPWEIILKELKEGNEKKKWMEREPYAYWKGNPFVAETRQDLLTCNATHKQDWNARLFIQDWILESKQGFAHSDVASQCTYRYKIYIEGYAWSVSEKYILACDSMTLLVKPHYHDFFTRSLQPVHHYWPIRDDDKCRSISFAVHWGNTHKQKAQAIGRAASEFIQEELKMEYVYDYMFHLLNEYSKLLRFEPKVPQGAMEVCSETMACHVEAEEDAERLAQKKMMMESLVKSPSITPPCTMPPPFDRRLLAAFLRRKLNSINQVEAWEKRHWQNLSKQQ